ncbi:MAG: type IV pilus assembly protein PilM [Phycisphaerae bacterium]
MPSTKTVWGIDVGQCALKALKLQWRDDRLRALAFDVIEHGKVLSQPDADEQALIRSALSKFLNRNNIKGSTVVISVPGQASFTRFIKLPPVEQRKIPEIVRYEARQQIPFDLEDVVWDYQTTSPPSAGPREVEVGIFAMKRDIVADYVSDFTAMRIEPDAVQMSPVALYNFLRYEQGDGSGGTILIDVGAENTNLVIADGDRVWIRNVPLGGNNFTNALCKEFKLQFAKAERLKRHAAESKHARQIFQAMRPVFGDLLTEIQRSIGYYTSLHRDSRIERVVALGNAFRLPGLAKFLSQNLGVEVEKVEGLKSLGESEVTSAPMFRKNLLSFGVAYGLALQGVGVAKISTSLLPPEILSQKILKKKRPFFVAAGAALVLAVGAFAYDQVATYSELVGTSGEVEDLEEAVDEVRQTNSQHQAAFDEQKQALTEQQQRIGRLEGLVERQDYAYRIWKRIWHAWPQDERWREYDAFNNQPLRTSLNIIELLNLATYYVPDVRAYSDQVEKGGTAGQISVIGYEAETPDEEKGRSRGEAVPGVLVEITGTTPKTGLDGQRFVNSELINDLKTCKRTVRLRTPAGVEVLASVPYTGLFGSRPEYDDFYGQRRGAGEEGVKRPKIPRQNDLWFKAQWVVHLDPLTPPQRKEVFQAIQDLVREAGLDTATKIDPGRVQGADSERLASIEPRLKELADTWLLGRDALVEIAAEGVTEEWGAGAPAEAAE